MIDPISLTVETLAGLVLTKTLEKGGPTLGKKALEQGGKLIKLLRRKSPETASAIEKVAEQPELAEQLPEEYGQAVLVAKVEDAAQVDSEIAEAVRALSEAVQAQPATIQNSGQTKIVNQASTINIKEQKVSI
ncbi:MAG: hypothetical protein F6J93_18615 [Oscillatoria sp. SIO1A7]|nr:hypothetical protein [Oscillatoria sp. SIO1A7]